MSMFDDTDLDSIDAAVEQSSPQVELDGAGKIYSYQNVTAKIVPNQQKLVKIPNDIMEFIESNSADGSVTGSILTHMLQIGKAYMQRQLIAGDYKIEFKKQ